MNRRQVCKFCARRPPAARVLQAAHYSRQASSSGRHHDEVSHPTHSEDVDSGSKVDGRAKNRQVGDPGAMSRRLEEATEEALLTGGIAGQRAIEHAGFSDELKERLLDKVKDAKFRKQFSGAFAQAEMPPTAGDGSRDMAASQPWTGTENTSDAVLRMLDDSKKPLKPGLRGSYQPPPVDMRIKREPLLSASQRIASARDKAQTYSASIEGTRKKNKKGLSEEEREQMRSDLKERFNPGVRGMPNTITGLASLANERIEDAIARGQFKNIPRGRGVQRDTRADNPFIDTTEYFMNKIIQRQEIVPPWIEKQQDLSKQLHIFRARLRNDWRRHAARMIASRGGSLLEQINKAEQYARSEQIYNPRARVANTAPTAAADQTDIEPAVETEQEVKAKLEEQIEAQLEKQMAAEPSDPVPEKKAAALPPPFRDADWEKAEMAYMKLSIDNLNTMTRAYNLMAPDLAKKPYFSLQRELDSCFADVAPQIAGEIKDRATGPRVTTGLGSAGKQASSIMDHFKGDTGPRIHLEADEKAYGLREWWRDVWKRN